MKKSWRWPTPPQISEASRRRSASGSVLRPPPSYLIGASVEAWDLGGALQEAAAALAQVLAHPAVQRGDGAAQTSPGVAQSLCHKHASKASAHHQQLKELLTPQRLPSTTAKFLNPMASSLRLTTSSSSDTFHKHQAVSEGGVHAGAGASAQWGVPSPAAFGYLLRCKPAVWWTGRRGPHPHCHLHPRTSGWRWRKPSWGEACWAPWAPPGLKALSQPGKEPTPARRVVNSQDGFSCWRSNIHLVHEPGVASVELQRQLPQAMGQRRKVDSVRPASHQTGPEELRHLQVEAASSCTATHTVKAKFRRSRCSRRKLGPTRCCLKPITYGLLQAPCYLLVPESTRDERERERETLVGGLVSTLLTLIEAAAAGGRMLPDCGSEEGGGEAP